LELPASRSNYQEKPGKKHGFARRSTHLIASIVAWLSS
jgi:hypothetical protein